MTRKERYYFPPVEQANENGLLASGGSLQPDCLLEAYYSGIFPWYNERQPILWWTPDPRMVLYPEELRISKSMQQLLRQKKFKVTYNTAFKEVIQNCAEIEREDQDGTWITKDVQEAYLRLFEMGYIISVEVWNGDNLIGGLYGVYLKDKKVFCGESMFSKESNASKYGFITLVQHLIEEGLKIIDCQVYTEHLASLGARLVPRKEFLVYLK